MKKLWKYTKRTLLVILVLIIGVSIYLFFAIQISTPQVDETILEKYQREKISENYYQVDDSWMKKNKHGIWEVYIQGSDFERGIKYGMLTKELMEKQEVHFVGQVESLVPNSTFRFFLKVMVAYFNKDIVDHVKQEYLREIYGASLSFSDRFDYIGPKYYRILNYHAAHDIGHALTDYAIVGCTSFSAKGEQTKDSSLIIGRNFDFYMGEGFAEDKVLLFVKPDTGFSYASYSWAGLMGVVSGMNEKGITVTLNAAKSDLPTGTKTPISLLAKEILQYASTIEEAISIAEKREIFVSESLLIGSASDNSTAIIEKSPSKQGVYHMQDNQLICANHYQSAVFENDSNNLYNIKNSDSKYRFDRMSELLNSADKIDVTKTADILRNRLGLGGDFIGLGNPKSINQLIAHHGIIFKPTQGRFWVSTPPYQLGEFLCYDLNELNFSEGEDCLVDSLNIAADSFMYTSEFEKFQAFKKTKQAIFNYSMLGEELNLDSTEVKNYIQNNPNSYITYLTLGDYYQASDDFSKAQMYYEKSLQFAVASRQEEKAIEEKIQLCREQM